MSTCLVLLLLNGLLGTVAHVILVDHVYCETHQEVEHAGEHTSAQSAHAAQGDLQDVAQAPISAHADTPLAPQSPAEDDPCELHLWLNQTAVPLPDLHASLLDLPPPADYADPTLPLPRVDILPPIDTLHVSPGHSPPAVHV